ncbi:MAG: hypothetical protein ACYCWE_05395 [Eubacteriales bacterium]
MNNGDLNDVLGRVLQNPEALSSIMKLAQGLRNNSEQNSAPAPQQNQTTQQTQAPSRPPQEQDMLPPEDRNIKPAENTQDTPDVPAGNILGMAGPQLSRLFNHDENRSRLLVALKPYLGKNRREKVDSIMNILQLMELAGTANLLPPRHS